MSFFDFDGKCRFVVTTILLILSFFVCLKLGVLLRDIMPSLYSGKSGLVITEQSS